MIHRESNQLLLPHVNGVRSATTCAPCALCCRVSKAKPAMSRIAGPLLAFAIALANAPANAQAGTTSSAPQNTEGTQRSAEGERRDASAQLPTADDLCRAVEQSAADNALPVEFFARVIWQESRFNATTVSPKGAEGIAQFMPETASWHGLSDPFDR